MKFRPISKVFARSLLTAFVMIASLNSFLSFGNYFSDEVLKSVEKHSSDSSILTNQAVTNGTATDQDGNTFAWKTFGDLDWALENANVTHYNDGITEIPLVGPTTDWINLESGGYSLAYATTLHGVTELVKFITVLPFLGIHDSASLNDPSLRKEFAPTGWRVATKADWENLTTFLNDNGYATSSTTTQNYHIGQSMASGNGNPSWEYSSYSYAPGYDPSLNNSSELNIKPYGFRVTTISSFDGYPTNVSQACLWANPNENLVSELGMIALYHNQSYAQINTISQSSVNNTYGYGVRFVRDTNPTDDTTPPVITGNASLTIQENQTAVSTYSASEDVTWTLSGVDSAVFDIANPTSPSGLVSYNSGELTFSSPPDFENPQNAGVNNNEYNVSLIATDSAGNVSNAFPVTVTVTDVDEDSPVITGSNTVSIQENQTAVSTYSANETVTWSLSGTDSGLFIISNAGELTFSSPPDFENPQNAGVNNNEYNVSLIATDSAGNVSDAFAVTVTVTDVDETPLIISGNHQPEVVENQTFVATYSANKTVASWSLLGYDSSKFSISNGGELSFNSAPDFENPHDYGTPPNNIYNVTVRATDISGSDAQKNVAITVTNDPSDDVVIVITGSQTVSVQENQTAVSTYSANETVTWSLSGTDSGLFIISNAGELTFSSPPDFENPQNAGVNNNEYNVSLIATDSAGNVSDAFAVTVTVTDVDDTDPVMYSGSSMLFR